MKDKLTELGFDFAFFLSGLLGALVGIKREKSKTIWQKAFTIISGGIISNYTAPVVPILFPLMTGFEVFMSFIIGIMGLNTVDYVWDFVTRNKDKNE